MNTTVKKSGNMVLKMSDDVKYVLEISMLALFSGLFTENGGPAVF